MVSGTDRERRAVALGLCHNRVTLCGRSGGHRALPGDAEESLDRPIGHRGYRFARCRLRPLPWRSQEEASPSPVYGARLLSGFGAKTPSRVQIPPPPQEKFPLAAMITARSQFAPVQAEQTAIQR